MVLVRRFGGWSPVEAADGVGTLRRHDGEAVEGVRYSFEVWHQFAQGFPGPYRSEGAVAGLTPADLAALIGQAVLLEMADGRFLASRIAPDATLLSHGEPSASDPWADGAT